MRSVTISVEYIFNLSGLYTKIIGTSSLNNNTMVYITNVSDENFLQALARYKDTFTSGVDAIPSILVENCTHIFVKPLYYLFNLFIKTSIFLQFGKNLSYV